MNLNVKELRFIKVIESKVNVKVIFFLCGNFFLILFLSYVKFLIVKFNFMAFSQSLSLSFDFILIGQ